MSFAWRSNILRLEWAVLRAYRYHLVYALLEIWWKSMEILFWFSMIFKQISLGRCFLIIYIILMFLFYIHNSVNVTSFIFTLHLGFNKYLLLYDFISSFKKILEYMNSLILNPLCLPIIAWRWFIIAISHRPNNELSFILKRARIRRFANL